MKFGGHQSFYLRDGWLYKGLLLSQQKPCWLEEPGAPSSMQSLGVGKNMALAIKWWLQATRLISPPSPPARQPTLTPLAHTILTYDPYFELDGTLFLLHYALATNKTTAPVWQWFFNHFSATEFDKEALSNACFSYMQIHSPKAVKDSTVDKDLQCLLRMYQSSTYEGRKNPESSTPSPFNKFSWLEQQGHTYKRHSLNMDPHIFAHLVGEFLNSFGSQAQSIALDELCTKENSVGRVFNLSIEQLSELVEQSQPYLSSSRTGGYFIITPHSNKLKHALKNYYQHSGQSPN